MNEKDFGLQPGEFYGADDTPTDLGTREINGVSVEFTQNEETSYVTGWVQGVGNVCGGYSLEDAIVNIRVRGKI